MFVSPIPLAVVVSDSQFCPGWDLDEEVGVVFLIRAERDSYEACPFVPLGAEDVCFREVSDVRLDLWDDRDFDDPDGDCSVEARLCDERLPDDRPLGARLPDVRPLDERLSDDRLLGDQSLADRPLDDRPLEDRPLDDRESTWVCSRCR